MDARRFDSMVKGLLSRRSALSLAAGIGVLLGLHAQDAAQAKCKKKCGPCKRCQKGKCKPKRGSVPCGPCQHCDRGQCKTLCPTDSCVNDGERDVCLIECDPACGICSTCNRIQGQCESDCASEFCTATGCRVPCVPPCGECSVCDFGECVALCESEQCADDRCEIDCNPPCGSDDVCIAGECFPACDPPCESDEGCDAGSPGNACISLAGDCSAAADVCFGEGSVRCTANGSPGRCVKTIDGASFCAQSVECTPCETDIDCQNQGNGPNSRCIAECELCFRSGGSGCVTFAGG